MIANPIDDSSPGPSVREVTPTSHRVLHAAATAMGSAVIGAAAGLFLSVLFLAIGVLRVALALLNGRSITLDDIGFVFGYMAAFLIGGFVAGLLWPLRRVSAGYYGIGIAAMTFVMGMISVHQAGSPRNWGTTEWLIWSLLSIAFGITIGHALKTSIPEGTDGLTGG